MESPGAVVIAPYSQQWPVEFARERDRLRSAFGAEPVAIEHIGSTAVPGLGAKPVIDILLGAASLAAIEARIAALEVLGYRYVPAFEKTLPQRRYFSKPASDAAAVHLHAVESGGTFWREHLAFRDALRRDDALRAEYLALKQRLALRFGPDRAGYTDAKAGFIRGVLDAP
jgi:GrpB-like predicted nucleotidyltransferase (UPF0157 family)